MAHSGSHDSWEQKKAKDQTKKNKNEPIGNRDIDGPNHPAT
jgi:hypothetical protein